MTGTIIAHRIALSVEQLMARARDESGIDIVDHDVVEPLTVILQSLNEESCLHEQGAVAMQEKLLRLLRNRLRMQRDFAAHPEIATQSIVAPIVICGMARTGSTKMQKLLASSGDFNWLPYWQSYNPALITGSRGESPDFRIRDAEAYCQWFDAASPENKFGHAIEAHEPDEESYMLEQCFRTACFLGWSELPGYLQWLSRQDVLAQFRYLRDLLKYLQWQGLQDSSKRWILKCPLYFGLEPALLEVFPDACLVMTHRHPRETVPSSCRLLETFHQPFTAAPISYIGFLEGTAAQIQQHIDVRRSRSDIRFLDIAFPEINASDTRVADKVYAFSNTALGDVARRNMQDWNERNPRNKQGVHRYALEKFGFTEKMIDEKFVAYIELIRDLFGDAAL